MILALEEKRKHLEESKLRINYKMESLEYSGKNVQFKINQLNEVKLQLDNIFPILNTASVEARDFLMIHIGFKDNRIVLARRLCKSWQSELKRARIISYDYMEYRWLILDVEKLITATENKLKNKRSKVCMYFDNDNPDTVNAVYKTATGINTSLLDFFKTYEKELNELNKERKAIKKVYKISKADPQ
jgi:hypothetical protein